MTAFLVENRGRLPCRDDLPFTRRVYTQTETFPPLLLDVESVWMRRTTPVMVVFFRAIVLLAGSSVSLIVSKNQRANFARYGVDDVVAG